MDLILKQLQSIKFNNRVRKNISPDAYDYLLFGKNHSLSKGKRVSVNNTKFPKLFELLQKIIKDHDKDFHYTGIIVNKNKKCNIHKDKGNIFKSYIIGLGNYEGGELMIENHRTGDISKYNIKNKWLKFDGCKNYHWTNKFKGERYSIVYFTNKLVNRDIIKIKNLTFYIRNHTTDEKVIDEVIKRNIYQKYNIKFDEKQVWLDLGGNIGTFSVLAGKSVKQVYSYEPIGENFTILKKNISLNKLDNVDAIQKAVSHTKKAVMWLPPTDYNKYQQSFYKNSKFWIRKNLGENKCITFRELMNRRKDVNSIKLDIEGSEMEILENFDYYDRVDRLVFEWSFDKDKSIKRFYNVIDKLNKYYTIKGHHRVNRDEKEFNHFPSGVLIYCWKESHLNNDYDSEDDVIHIGKSGYESEDEPIYIRKFKNNIRN